MRSNENVKFIYCATEVEYNNSSLGEQKSQNGRVIFFYHEISAFPYNSWLYMKVFNNGETHPVEFEISEQGDISHAGYFNYVRNNSAKMNLSEINHESIHYTAIKKHLLELIQKQENLPKRSSYEFFNRRAFSGFRKGGIPQNKGSFSNGSITSPVR